MLPNLPFLFASPREWWTSMWLPMSLPAFPAGLGPILLSIGHLVPYAPPALYAGLEALALLGMLWAYARFRPALADIGLLLALVPLFFAFRSSANYFAVAPWLALYAATCLARRGASTSRGIAGYAVQAAAAEVAGE